ncbi:alpha/beta fold hydrolase [Actinacidiphila acidipaludis]|uniref:Alpha/beta hydrolase n=1 Tax=Actinacidiphila acidipaludis TaxID=2873382 RepID=A0ABS7Q805_9ACTN|nr:alpha/beta hydrolase [Streptomyces acidipaludis]MBY8877904.1 alpha/beta hydrolase [Streptomyces acidipaludis]
MATFVLVPGADGSAWYWHLVAPALRAHGHDVVTLDLPSHDSADLDAFADAITAAASDALAAAGREDRAGRPLVLVAASLAGFSAPLVCGRMDVDRLVLVNAMVPRPGETAGEWWGATGQPAARAARAEAMGRHGADAEFDLRTDFFHDVPAAVTEEAFAAAPGGPPSGVFAQPWPLKEWPSVPTRFIQGADDRFFPADFQRRVVGERLGIEVEELPGGHLMALSRPQELTEALLKEA